MSEGAASPAIESVSSTATDERFPTAPWDDIHRRRSAVERHLDLLEDVDMAAASAWQAEKRNHHLRLVGHVLFPERPEFEITVSVLVVAETKSEELSHTIDHLRHLAALPNPLVRLQSIVVFYGADSESIHVGRAPAGIECAAIHGIRAEARQHALARSRGQFIRFLRPGEELDIRALAMEVDLFLMNPEIKLVASRDALVGWREADLLTLATEPNLALLGRRPLGESNWMVPKWIAQQVEGFDNDFRMDELSRFWFQLARVGVKAMVASQPCVTRREAAATNDRSRLEQCRQSIESDLAGLRELSSCMKWYRYVPWLFARARQSFRDAVALGLSERARKRFEERMIQFLETVGEREAPAGVTAIVMDQIHLGLCRAIEDARSNAPTSEFLGRCQEVLAHRLSQVTSVSGADLRRWLPDLPPQPFETLDARDRAALKLALEQIQTSVLLGELPATFAAMSRVGADFPGHPYERYWRGAARLARVLGDEGARTLCRRKFYRAGWQWLGRTRLVLERANVAS